MIGFIVAGLIIGALARLIKPGKQNLGIVALLLGLVGSVIGCGEWPRRRWPNRPGTSTPGCSRSQDSRVAASRPGRTATRRPASASMI